MVLILEVYKYLCRNHPEFWKGHRVYQVPIDDQTDLDRMMCKGNDVRESTSCRGKTDSKISGGDDFTIQKRKKKEITS